MSASASLLQVILSLVLMVGLILAIAWMARRFGQPFFQQQQKLRLIASLSLGVKEKIILVEVDGKQLVLGVTPQQITSLHVIDVVAKEESNNSDPVKEIIPIGEKNITSDFSKKLMEILKGS